MLSSNARWNNKEKRHYEDVYVIHHSLVLGCRLLNVYKVVLTTHLKEKIFTNLLTKCVLYAIKIISLKTSLKCESSDTLF